MKFYTCKCGRQNEFGVWVAAHWNDQVVHSCDCGRKNSILRGRVVRWGKELDEKPKVRKMPETNPID
jgi:hypothetical protein